MRGAHERRSTREFDSKPAQHGNRGLFALESVQMERTATSIGVVICILGTLLAGQPALAGPVEKAYRAIPHRRTVFKPKASQIPPREQQYLTKLFRLVDQAIVQRVGMTQWVLSGGKRGAKAKAYPQILGRLGKLEPPESLGGVHTLVVGAIKEQKKVLDRFARKEASGNPESHPLVQSSSQKLHRAYGELMRTFPQEPKHNKDAFYDYLCALDFL